MGWVRNHAANQSAFNPPPADWPSSPTPRHQAGFQLGISEAVLHEDSEELLVGPGGKQTLV